MIAMPVGPVNILCIHRTIEGGWKVGRHLRPRKRPAGRMFLRPLSRAFSITLVVPVSLYGKQFWISLFRRYSAGHCRHLVLSSSGPESAGPRKRKTARARTSDFEVDIFSWTLTNPTTVLFHFLAILAALGIGQSRPVVADRVSRRRESFCGSMLWWIVLVAS